MLFTAVASVIGALVLGLSSGHVMNGRNDSAPASVAAFKSELSPGWEQRPENAFIGVAESMITNNNYWHMDTWGVQDSDSIAESIYYRLGAVLAEQTEGVYTAQAAREWFAANGIELIEKSIKGGDLKSGKTIKGLHVRENQCDSAFFYVPNTAEKINDYKDYLATMLPFNTKTEERRKLDKQEIRKLKFKDCKVRDYFLSESQKRHFFTARGSNMIMNVRKAEGQCNTNFMNDIFTKSRGEEECKTIQYGDAYVAYVCNATPSGRPEKIRLVRFEKIISLQAGCR